jgi:hypothetical protein
MHHYGRLLNILNMKRFQLNLQKAVLAASALLTIVQFIQEQGPDPSFMFPLFLFALMISSRIEKKQE